MPLSRLPIIVLVLVLVLASRLLRGIPLIAGHPDYFGASRLFRGIPNLIRGFSEGWYLVIGYFICNYCSDLSYL